MCGEKRMKGPESHRVCGYPQPTFSPLSSANIRIFFSLNSSLILENTSLGKKVSWLTFSPLLSIAARPSILKSHNQRLHRRRHSIRVRWFVCGNKGGCGIFNRMSPPYTQSLLRTYFPSPHLFRRVHLLISLA